MCAFLFKEEIRGKTEDSTVGEVLALHAANSGMNLPSPILLSTARGHS